jgi:hypothetical protein
MASRRPSCRSCRSTKSTRPCLTRSWHVGSGTTWGLTSDGKAVHFSGRSTWRFGPLRFPQASAPRFSILAATFPSGSRLLRFCRTPRTSKAGLSTVYPLLEGLVYCDRKVGARKYAAYVPTRKKGKSGKQGTKEPRRPLPCWIYGKLYQARNDFLHGNHVSVKTLSPTGTKDGLFLLAPSAYRLALTGFLKLTVDRNLPYWLSDSYKDNPALRKKREAYDRQSMIERALLRIRR